VLSLGAGLTGLSPETPKKPIKDRKKAEKAGFKLPKNMTKLLLKLHYTS